LSLPFIEPPADCVDLSVDFCTDDGTAGAVVRGCRKSFANYLLPDCCVGHRPTSVTVAKSSALAASLVSSCRFVHSIVGYVSCGPWKTVPVLHPWV